ncbi:AP-3 complex subunit mu [Cryptococcus wingfieldii CBS 7118]|uniref:AP-3 complex subunit mu n=1 Tax=Cryptococcus wingfieldii CBS 7118 TaxID=1295528 RepID=A0A1E3JCR0_9TREE|nr:AP-3 complex subunit mu [Cryptococcus wingfieldii CBS 7118]ODN98475.1 AP-3 complex subunit mu [Cryptococcus wingfieldii CBS 7118]
MTGRIDGIIILDNNGKPIISSNFSSHAPSYPSLHIDAYNAARKRTAELDPVLWVNTLDNGRTGMAGAGLCHSQRDGLCFLIPVGLEVNPLFGFSFLDSFLETLRDYLGQVTESMIKDNFDIVYMLIEEMLDEGHPLTMETNMLKDIVLPPSIVRKILNAAGITITNSSRLSTTNSAPFTAPIPWRKPGVRHNNNEIYFDIEESLDAIVDRKGNVLSSNVWGRINCNSRLSGNPDLLLSFANPKTMDQCSFHPCIRHGRWKKDSVLSFIPPDGKFRLLEYEASASTAKNQLPISLKAAMATESHSAGRFSLTLSSRVNSLPLENIVISIFLGKGATSVNATATGDRRPLHSHVGKEENAEGFVGGGTWDFDPHTQVLRWRISSLVTTERSPTLAGSFTTTEAQPIISPSFEVNFSVQNFCFSNLRVDKLKVQGDVMYKPFKGVKMLGRAGKVEVRW